MSSTTTNYINKINQTYPDPGIDNDSQGFRDNFKNISLALSSADADIVNLQLNSVKLNQTNDFGQTLIKQAQFQNCSTYVFDNTAISNTGDVIIDYSQGSYQKIKLGAGLHNISFLNWPGNNKAGFLTLDITTSTVYSTSVNFVDNTVINLSSEALPLTIAQGSIPTIFNINSDGTSGNLFVKRINDKVLTATTLDINSDNVTGTNITVVSNLKVGDDNLHIDSNYNIVVANNTSSGRIALLPDQVNTRFAGVINDPSIGTTAQQFTVGSTAGINVGASFVFNSNTMTNTYTVLAIDGNKITTQTYDSAYLSGDPIGSWPDMLFTNPRFANQPDLLSLRPTVPSSLTGTIGDLKGQVYATANALYVSFADYRYNTPNWFKVSSDAAYNATISTQAVTSNDTNIATTAFVHNILPYGTIIMWSGSINAIPTGWRICDGNVGTPDLTDKFIIGAKTDNSSVAKTNVTGSLTQTGGTKDAIVVNHTHGITDDGHTHTYNNSFYGNGTGNLYVATADTFPNGQSGSDTGSATTGITINSTGSDGTNQNLPPYYALAFIMKITGD